MTTHTGTLRLGLAQMDIAKGDIASNLATVRAVATAAAEDGVELLLLPELWPTAYDLERASEHARTGRTVVLPSLERLARELRMHIAGSLLLDGEPGGEEVFNTFVIAGPGGLVGEPYRKIHLFAPMDEARYLAAGDAPVTCDLPWGRAGLAICYDLRFPELFRAYAEAGAELILLVAEWPRARADHWHTLARARAIENQCIVAACNRLGTTNDVEFGGGSLVAGPWGELLLDAGGAAGVHAVTVELGIVPAARGRLPVLADRRMVSRMMESSEKVAHAAGRGGRAIESSP